jgi:tetratricopeptide (TPR) repeat protein
MPRRISGNPAAGEILDLLLLAGARPGEALVRSREILAGKPASYEASVAHQAIGSVLREFGNLDEATRELRAALRCARAAGSRARQADVLATLGVALIHRGRSGPGLAMLASSLELADGPAAGHVLARRGIALWILGRHPEALDDLRRAIRVLRSAADTIWEARALSARALVCLSCGSTRQAELDLGRAGRLFATTSQDLEVAFNWHNRGIVAFRSGDVPAALAHFDEAHRRYRLLAVPMPDLCIDRCAALLAAGLAGEAFAETEAAVGGFQARGRQLTKKAELLLSAARAGLAAAQPVLAMERAGAAWRMFDAQDRAWWAAHARLLLLQARLAAGLATARLLRQAEQAAVSLDALGSPEAPQARLLAGRVAVALGRSREADAHFAAASRSRRRRVPALLRAQGWLAEALRAEAAGDRRRLLAACGRGFAVLDEHQLTFGASELRAQATAQGAELAAIAQRAALASGRPRLLLAWSERWRATTLASVPVRPTGDPGLQADLTAVRDVASRLDRARGQGDPVAALQREQLRLEAAIRARVRRSRGRRGRGGYQFAVTQLLGALGDARLVQIVESDGDLHILVCGSGRIRRFPGGRADAAALAVDHARFSLGRLAHRRATAHPADALSILETAGRRLESLLLGPAAGQLGDGPVIIVPPGRLHAVPWALLPALRDRACSVAPSARAWLQARSTVPPPRPDPVLVRGPGLGGGGLEVSAIAAEYRRATVLGSGTATAQRVLDALDGAGLAHIAAHGTFRADSPLFSSLRLDDGPLTGHDLERLRRAPYRLILSACDSGVLAPAGADELLGLTAALTPRGTAGIVASVVPVNDQATVELMLALHRCLRRGAALAEALRDARRAALAEPPGDDRRAALAEPPGDGRSGSGGDAVRAATAWSFIALGSS